MTEKIALFCDVDKQAVIPMVTTDNLYKIPLLLEEAGVADLLLEKFHLEAKSAPDWSAWKRLAETNHINEPKVKIALVGKYVELHDAYFSVREALHHAAMNLGVGLQIDWVQSEDLEKGESWDRVKSADGILIPGGFGSRGTNGKIAAIRYARQNRIPCLGLCLGMQLMVVEFARHIFNNELAHSTEFDLNNPYPVIDLMPDQKNISDLGGTMRLGLYPCHLQPGSISARVYGEEIIEERHRHRFEFNNKYRDILANGGLTYSGLSPDGRLVEIVELQDHPFMLGTQFHPEFLSRPNRPHPLFSAFMEAACNQGGIPCETGKSGAAL